MTSKPNAHQPIANWEEQCANATPAIHSLMLDGWLVRISPGYFTINNSVWPLHPGRRPLAEKIDFCENLLAQYDRPAAFRVAVPLSGTGANAELEAALQARGYEVHNPNFIMVRPELDAAVAAIAELDLDTWLDTIYRIHPTDDPTLKPNERRLLARQVLPARYAVVEHDGDARGYGRSVRQGPYQNIENLWIHPNWRGQGLGTQLITGLLARERADGARIAFLGVNEPNHGARRLYERLGFQNRYLYRYWMPPA